MQLSSSAHLCSFVHYILTNIINEEVCLQCSSNSEASASELLEIREEMFPLAIWSWS